MLSGIRFIPYNRIGMVEKRFGSQSIKSGFVALNGEVGYQPDILRGGLHFLLTPIQYMVHIGPPGDDPAGQDRLLHRARWLAVEPWLVVAIGVVVAAIYFVRG